MKPKHGDIVQIVWVDIHSDSGWASEETLAPVLCTSMGFFNCWKDDYVLIYASYNEHDIGDRTAIPKSVIKDITIIKRNERKGNRKAKKLPAR